jgi:hypothetical protein
MIIPSLCLSCTRRKPEDKHCEAFPKAIPDNIFFYGDDHRQPVDGDHGKQYNRDPKKPEEFLDWLRFSGNAPS